jgi:hypothetical protein
VLTREAFPIDCARLRFGIASAYNDRIRGDRANNPRQINVEL